MLKKTGFLLIALAASLVAQSQVTFQANETSGCTPLGTVISVTSPAAGSITSYAWTVTYPDGSAQSSTNAQFIAIFSQPGSYDVSLTVNGNQTQTVVDYITVFANPTASFTATNTTGCFPLPVNFSDNSAQGSAPINAWSWDFGNGGTSQDQNPTFTYSQAGSYTPILTVTDANGCFSSAVVPALVSVSNQFPNANFTTSTTLTCTPPEVITFTNSSTGNGALTSTWEFGDGSSPATNAAASVAHSFATTGTFDVCLTVTNSIGCSNEECHTVTIFDEAVAAFSMSDTDICAGEAVTMTSTTSPVPSQFLWDADGNGTNESTSASTTFLYTTPGTYYPRLIVIYSPTCSDTLVAGPITVQQGLELSMSAIDSSSCVAPFTTTLNNTTAGSGLTTTWAVNGIAAGSGSSLSYTFPSFGSYDVSMVVTSPQGCTSTLVLPDFIAVEEPSISFTAPGEACYETPFTISNCQVNAPEEILSIEWDFNEDGITDATGSAPTYEYEQIGAFSVTATVTTVSGCTSSSTSSNPIEVLADVSTGITASANISCAGESIEFCITGATNNQYTWNFDDGSGWITMASGEDCITHDYQDTGYFDLSITVFNGACSSIETWEDYIYITPPVSIWQFSLDCENLTTVTFAEECIEADSLVWNFGDGSPIVINDSAPQHTFPGPGNYEVSLTAYNDLLGCPDETTATVIISPPNTALDIVNLSQCPPALVDISSQANNSTWNIGISNGDSLHVHWDDDVNLWMVDYLHADSTVHTEHSQFADFWPDLIFDVEGCYDFSVSVIDRNGCEASAFYDDAVCVSASTDFATFVPTIIDSCEAVIISFAATAPGLVEWNWTFSDGASSTEPSPTHSFLPPYYYNFPVTATLEATDAQGCSSTVTQEIDIHLPVIPSFSVIGGTACQQEEVLFNNTTTGPATAYTWNFGDPASGASNTSTSEDATHFYADNGSYTVCLSADNGYGCVRTHCANNVVNIVNPTASFTFTSTIVNCLYGVSFDNTSTGTVTQIEWDFGDGQTGSGDMVFHTYPLGVYDVTLVVSNAAGCSDTIVVEDIFNFSDVIGPFSTVLDSANCAPFGVDFAAYNPADTFFSYFWDFNDGSGDPSGSTTTSHTYTAPGTYCPSIIMTDPNGCQVYIPCAEPIVVDEFEMEYTIPSAICYGDQVEVTIFNGDSYSWSDPGAVSPGANASTFILHPENSMDLYLTGVYSDCQRTDLIHIDVNPLPVVTLTVTPEVCHGDPSFTLDGGEPNGPSGVYAVNGSAASLFDPAWNPGTYEVTYSYTDDLGCTGTSAAPVVIHALPVVTLDAFDPACHLDPVMDLDGGSPAGGMYTLEGGFASTFDPANAPGQYAVNYIYTDSNGCVNSAGETITIHPLPVPVVAVDPVCAYDAVVIENTSTIASGIIASASWDLGVAGTSQLMQPGAVNFPGPGEYPIHVELTSDAGCVSALDTIASVWHVPVSDFTVTSGCQGTALLLVSESSIAEGTITDWTWLAEGQSFSGNDSLSYAFTSWGDLDVALIATSDNGCSDTLVSPIMVYPAPVLNASATTVCFGDETQFSSGATIPVGGIVGYTWNFGDGSAEENSANADNLYAVAGTYTATITAVSNLGCSSAEEIPVVVHATPVAEMTAAQETVCEGALIELLDLSSVASPSEITEWMWFMDGVLVSEDESPLIVAEQAGTYDLLLVVNTNFGCMAQDQLDQYIQVNPTPVAGFTVQSDELTMSSPLVHVQNTASADVSSWSYDFGDGAVENFSEGTHSYDAWDTFVITQVVSNTFGCADTATRVVEVNQEMLIYVPNAFTPDGNGNNEFFKPVISGFVPTYFEFQIFDRWGNIVFESTDPEGCWNGQFRNNGEMSPDGAYNWQLDIRSETSPVIRRLDGVVVLLK